MPRAASAPLFGLAMVVAFLLPWLALQRDMTVKVGWALLLLGTSGMFAAAIALLAMRAMRQRPRSARGAAAAIILALGTCGLMSVFMTFGEVAEHTSEGLPLFIFLLVVAFAGASSLYNVLSVAGWLLLPLGVPVIAGFAVWMSAPILGPGRRLDIATGHTRRS